MRWQMASTTTIVLSMMRPMEVANSAERHHVEAHICQFHDDERHQHGDGNGHDGGPDAAPVF